MGKPKKDPSEQNLIDDEKELEQNVEKERLLARDLPVYLGVINVFFAILVLFLLFTFYLKLKNQTELLISSVGLNNTRESSPDNMHSIESLNKLNLFINDLQLKQTDILNKYSEALPSKEILKNLSKNLENNTLEIKTKKDKLISLSDDQIKSVFKIITEDDKSEFGKMIKMIKDLGDKKPVIPDNISTQDKNNSDILQKENNKLKESIGNREKEISKEKDAVSKLTNDITLKANKIFELEAKIKLIDSDKIVFKGLPGSYAILLTNSADFQLPKPLLETVFGVLEKQNGTSLDAQKFGMYIATGEKISIRYDFRNKSKSQNTTEPEPLIGRPTECIIEVGNSFFKNAFGDGKEPAIPIADRKVIIIATWSAKAPKFDSDGWDKISQVDAILIQTPKNKDLREASNWLDFIIKKNGRLLFVQGTDDFSGGTPAVDQLQKHLSTLLNTKKD